MANQRSPPYADFQAGSGSTDASGDATISFPRSFPGVPKVFLQGIDSGAKGIVLDVVSKTATGFVAKARKVTGLTTDSKLGSHSHTVNSHTHSIGSPSTASFVTGGTKYTTAVASSGHTHTITYTSTSSGFTALTTNQLAYHRHSGVTTDTGYTGFTGAGASHYHAYFKANSPTGTPSATTTVMYDLTFTTSSAVTSIPSGTGSASPGTSSVNLAHTHSVGAPVLSISFDYFAVLA